MFFEFLKDPMTENACFNKKMRHLFIRKNKKYDYYWQGVLGFDVESYVANEEHLIKKYTENYLAKFDKVEPLNLYLSKKSI